MNTEFFKLSAMSLAAFVFAALPVLAEEFSDFWQGHRIHFNQLSDDACEENEAAYAELWDAAMRDKNPVAMNDLAWLYATDACDQFDEDPSRAADLIRLSANAGYPMAQKNFAERLITGNGVDQDFALAHEYFQRAIDAGYGGAAISYAEFFLDGKYLAKDVNEARRFFEIASANGADQSSLDKLAEKITQPSPKPARVSAHDAWDYEEGEAGWSLVKNGKVRSRVFLGHDVQSGGYYFGMTRNSTDPMIHFMGVSVSRGGQDIELDAGDCYANRCLSNYQDDDGTVGSQFLMTVPRQSESAFLETLKSGRDITFRYQTEKSLKQDNFFRNTLGLKGSRQAIEQVEAAKASAQPRTATSMPTPPASPDAAQTNTSKAAKTYYEGDIEDGDILCPATEIAGFPTHFYSTLLPRTQQSYPNDPTKRIKPVSTDFLEQAGTTVWNFQQGATLVLYKGGRAIGLNSTVRDGVEVIKKYYEGSWEVTGDEGVKLHIQGNPGYQLGDRHFQCKGGTMALNLGVGAPKPGGGFVHWQMCHMLWDCEWWYENRPDQRKPAHPLSTLIEWSPGEVAPTALRWSEEEIRPR